MNNQLSSITSRVLFVGSFALAGIAVFERLANLFGFTLAIARMYSPFRFLELAAVALLFVIALQLREIKRIPGTGHGGQ